VTGLGWRDPGVRGLISDPGAGGAPEFCGRGPMRPGRPAKKTHRVVSPKGPKGAAQKRNGESFSRPALAAPLRRDRQRTLAPPGRAVGRKILDTLAPAATMGRAAVEEKRPRVCGVGAMSRQASRMGRASPAATRGLLLLAVLTATVGVHVIHPFFHSSRDCPGHGHDSAAPPPAGRSGHEARLVSPAGPLAPGLGQACPICLFLATCHSWVAGSSAPPLLLDGAPNDLARVEPPAPASPVWYVASARAPPAVLS
jgi:hypothetical protein